MHASIRKYRIDTDAVAALKFRVEDGFVPIISKLPGFVSYMVVDAGDGVVASISIFESEEAAEQSNAAAAAWVKESLSDVITKAPESRPFQSRFPSARSPTCMRIRARRRTRRRSIMTWSR